MASETLVSKNYTTQQPRKPRLLFLRREKLELRIRVSIQTLKFLELHVGNTDTELKSQIWVDFPMVHPIAMNEVPATDP
jgi:hypothetical protein